MTVSAHPGPPGGRRHITARTGLVVLFVAIGCVMMIIIASGRSNRAFDLDSSAPDGYLALRLVLEDNGITTRSVGVDDPVLDLLGTSSVIYVPEPDHATGPQLERLARAAERGATVVYGSVPPSQDQLDERSSGPASEPDDPTDDEVDQRLLVELPPELVHPGVCDIAVLEDLGPIDVFDARSVSRPLPQSPAIPVDAEVTGTCYGSADDTQVVELSIDSRHLFVISSPYLWTNARLKASTGTGVRTGGGGPTTTWRADNDLMAWRILTDAQEATGPGSTGGSTPTWVVVVDTLGGAGSVGEGGVDLLTLLPLPFKAFSVILIAAAAVFVWTRSMRLGKPVHERNPVTVEASELTAAIGRLFVDDPVFINRGSEALRREARAQFGAELGLGPDVEPSILCHAVGTRSQRDAGDVADVLYGSTRIETIAAVMDLDDRIERLRMEVGDGRSL